MPEKDNLPITTVTAKRSSPRSSWAALSLFVALAALLLAGWQWFDSRQQLTDMKLQLSEASVGLKEEHGAQKALREQVDGLQAKLGALEGKLGEYQGQSASLENLYQDVARSRETATLLEVEQAITLGSQQLQLAANRMMRTEGRFTALDSVVASSCKVCASTDSLRVGTASDPEDVSAMASGEAIILEVGGAIDVTMPILQTDGKWTTVCGVTMERNDMDREQVIANAKTIAMAVKNELGDCCANGSCCSK